LRIEEQFDIASPIEELYAELNDVAGIGYCIAGVKVVTVLDPDRSRWRIEQRFGAIARTFNLEARISVRRPPEHIGFEATGQDVELTGSVELERLSAEETHCEIVIDVNALGPLVPLLEIFAKGPQRQLIRQTIKNIRLRLEGTPIEAPATPEAPRGRSRLRRFLRRLLRRSD